MPTAGDIVDNRAAVPPVVLKGSVFTLPILKLNSCDMAAIEAELSDRLASALDFFKDAPVVIDLELTHELEPGIDFSKLSDSLRRHKLVPVGVQNGTDIQHNGAKDAGFAVVTGQTIDRFIEHARNSDTQSERVGSTRDTDSAATTPVGAPVSTVFITEATTKVIYQPIRSGQRIYAKGGDLIVLAAVNAGAEIMADGNLHIYAPLRGRALAGVDGNTQSRIFCYSMEAELVAVAGNYRVFEDQFPQALYKKPVQVYLQGEQLHVEPIR